MSTSSSSSVVAITAPQPSGRLAVMTAYAVAAAAIPIPILPDRMLIRVRGAVVHDIVSRHGLSLTSDARALLADPDSEQRPRMVKVAETVVRQVLRRLKPLGAINSLSRGLEVFALGLLLERYITEVRPTGQVRMHHEEARKVRGMIDRAALRALSPSLKPGQAIMADGLEDLRDELTRWVDAILLTSAALPSYLERRLEAAFDQVVGETPGSRDG
jgi:hypothetical protein